jgi:hypothetical protein
MFFVGKNIRKTRICLPKNIKIVFIFGMGRSGDCLGVWKASGISNILFFILVLVAKCSLCDKSLHSAPISFNMLFCMCMKSHIKRLNKSKPMQ